MTNFNIYKKSLKSNLSFPDNMELQPRNTYTGRINNKPAITETRYSVMSGNTYTLEKAKLITYPNRKNTKTNIFGKKNNTQLKAEDFKYIPLNNKQIEILPESNNPYHNKGFNNNDKPIRYGKRVFNPLSTTPKNPKRIEINLYNLPSATKLEGKQISNRTDFSSTQDNEQDIEDSTPRNLEKFSQSARNDHDMILSTHESGCESERNTHNNFFNSFDNCPEKESITNEILSVAPEKSLEREESEGLQNRPPEHNFQEISNNQTKVLVKETIESSKDNYENETLPSIKIIPSLQCHKEKRNKIDLKFCKELCSEQNEPKKQSTVEIKDDKKACCENCITF